MNLESSITSIFQYQVANPAYTIRLIQHMRQHGLDIKVVTITGGPCAGKTSCLLGLLKEFKARDYEVILQGEAATIVRAQEFFKAEQGWHPINECQRLIIAENENTFYNNVISLARTHISGTKRKVLIIRDRSSLDGAAYVNDMETFEAILSEMRLNISDLAYADATVFLHSLAEDKPDLYQIHSSNNPERFEDVHLAKIKNRQLMDVYARHTHPIIIANDFPSFEDKVNHVVWSICEQLGEPRLEKEVAFFVDSDISNLLNILGVNSDVKPVHIEQFYMENGDRYRCVTYSQTSRLYVKTKKIDIPNSTHRIEDEWMITMEEYLTQKSLSKSSIRKLRYSIPVQKGNIYHIVEIDVFENPNINRIRIEIEYHGDIAPEFSDFFGDLAHENATGDKQYSNQSLSEIKNPLF